MPFNFSGTMREVQWRMLRRFVLRERPAVRPRLRAIEAELNRIGSITAFYEQRTQTVQTANGALQEVSTVSERRLGMSVRVGSSLEKLLWAYVVQGGNPCDISLFLEPDDIIFLDKDPTENVDINPNIPFTDKSVGGAPPDQPYYGVVAPQSADSYGPGGRFRGGLPTFIRSPYNLIGRYIDLSDASSSIAIRTDAMRRWTAQSISELGRLEHTIRKLCDLREQLRQERDEVLVQAVGGTVPDLDLPDPTRFSRAMHLSRIVSEMDAVWYEVTDSGQPDLSTVKVGTGDNPQGISNFDTLFNNPEDTDPYSSL